MGASRAEASTGRSVGRYVLHGELAAGGMATVHFGRLRASGGFSRTVAIKRLHPQFAKDPEFVAMFLDEARVAARVRHPNVVHTLDVVSTEDEIFLVMEYVPGESLSRVLRAVGAAGKTVPPRVAVSIASGILHGLHAAHEATNEHGEPLGIVHRDVSPQNVLVGIDGLAHVLDFGVAKAVGRVQTTREGQLKGKLSYMSPEQLAGGSLTRQSDIYAAAVVLWETLVGQRLFEGENEAQTLVRVIEGRVQAPSLLAPDVPPRLDEVVMRGLARDPADRFATAREMALALERSEAFAAPSEVGEWLESIARGELAKRAARVAEIEKRSASSPSDSYPSIHDAPKQEIELADATSSLSGIRTAAAELPSQVSTISVSKSEYAQWAPPRPRRSKMLAFVGVVTLLATAAVGVTFITGRPQQAARMSASAAPAIAPETVMTTARAPAPPSTGTAAATATAASTAGTESLDPAPVLTADYTRLPLTASPATGTAVITSSPAPKAIAIAPRPAPKPAAAPAPAPPKPTASECDPPYTRDAQGHKHYKLNCL